MAYVIQAMTKLHVYKWHNDAKVTERLDQEGRKVSARQIGLYIYIYIYIHISQSATQRAVLLSWPTIHSVLKLEV